MLVFATTAVWGPWHLEQFVGVNLPSLLSEGNLPALAKEHQVRLEIVTTASDAECLSANPMFSELSARYDVHTRLLEPGAIDVPIATHHRIWRDSVEHARREGAMALFLPPDVVWGDGSLRSVARRISEGRRALFNTYLRVSDETIGAELRARFATGDGSLRVPPRCLVEAGFRHVHPLMSSYLVDRDHLPHHTEFLMWAVPGEGVLVRLLARELLCFDPARLPLNSQALLAELPDESDMYLFTDSDELCAASLAPLWKDHAWYEAARTVDALSLAIWWLEYDSPVNSWLWRRPVRYHVGPCDEERWQVALQASEKLIDRIERMREILRLHRALRSAGFDGFARLLGSAALEGALCDRWDPRLPGTVLVPTNRVLAESGGGRSPEALVLAHQVSGHLTFAAPWSADSPRGQRAWYRFTPVGAPPEASPGCRLAGYGFRSGALRVYPVDALRA